MPLVPGPDNLLYYEESESELSCEENDNDNNNNNNIEIASQAGSKFRAIRSRSDLPSYYRPPTGDMNKEKDIKTFGFNVATLTIYMAYGILVLLGLCLDHFRFGGPIFKHQNRVDVKVNNEENVHRKEASTKPHENYLSLTSVQESEVIPGQPLGHVSIQLTETAEPKRIKQTDKHMPDKPKPKQAVFAYSSTIIFILALLMMLANLVMNVYVTVERMANDYGKDVGTIFEFIGVFMARLISVILLIIYIYCHDEIVWLYWK
eukprot:Pgem_evm1s9544